MDKVKKAEHRKLRKKAIKLQNTSARKMTLAEALREVSKVKDNV